ncbi:MAG TPA: DNA polymerase I, partial [Clostridia bacterium]|nr:DNA polymerase I [Clostridia bacterium]
NAANIYCLYEKQLKVLQETGMLDLMLKIEMPLLQVLYDMETAGFVINRESLIKLQHEFSGVLAGLEERIFELAGESFNINSPKQISRILFDKLNLRAGRKTKTGFSTDSDVLEGLADKHPIVPLIMEYRSYMKLKGTYIDGMLSITETGNCIHTRFNQTVASTGRISSVEPNLQNIPVRTELGRRIRLAFVPRSEDYMLVDADYSQIELRVLAHLSGDEQMIAAFLNDEDIHASTAATVFKIPLSEVTPQQRNFCKAVNFGVVYGISDFGLARNLGIPRKTAHEFIEAYFAQYPSIKAYLDGLKKFAYEKGYAQTLFGRRRQIPELKSANRNVRLAGERIAMNMPIQGTAADIIKMAMINVNCEIKNNNYKSRLILQVHDELIIDAHRDELDMMKKMLKEKMENVVKLSVPIKVELSVGKSWFETK